MSTLYTGIGRATGLDWTGRDGTGLGRLSLRGLARVRDTIVALRVLGFFLFFFCFFCLWSCPRDFWLLLFAFFLFLFVLFTVYLPNPTWQKQHSVNKDAFPVVVFCGLVMCRSTGFIAECCPGSGVVTTMPLHEVARRVFD